MEQTVSKVITKWYDHLFYKIRLRLDAANWRPLEGVKRMPFHYDSISDTVEVD
jgi:hypothetical protein